MSDGVYKHRIQSVVWQQLVAHTCTTPRRHPVDTPHHHPLVVHSLVPTRRPYSCLSTSRAHNSSSRAQNNNRHFDKPWLQSVQMCQPTR